MTKAMRLGASAVLILGGVGVGSFVGCSSDPDPVAPGTDTGTDDTMVDDTGTPDTGDLDTGMMTDTGTPKMDMGTDTPMMPKPADRAVTLLFGSPDLGAKYACFGAFIADPATNDPYQALGPIGIPTEATMDPKKFAAIPYGAVIPLPLDTTAQAALEGLTTVIYLVDSNPLTKMPASTCKDEWKTVRGDTKAWKKFAPKTIVKGDHALVAVTGCKGTAPTGECGDGNNLEFRIDKLSTTAPTTFAGAMTGPKVGIQFVHYSRYAGIAVPSTPPTYQGIDVYLLFRKVVPMSSDAGPDDSGDATSADAGMGPTPAAAPVKIADNVKYGDLGMTVGVRAGDNPEETVMFLVPHGTAPCVPGPSAPTCAATPIPLKAFLNAYKPVGGGFIDGQNQFFALTGAPIPKGATDAGPDPSTVTIRVPMGSGDAPKP